jgi:hypothetical protein
VYGTVAHLQLKPGMEEKLRQLDREEAELNLPGFVFEHIYRLDQDPQKYIMVIAFVSREAYLANASSPEQHGRYLRFRELLAADPEWHDGEIFASHPPTP